MTGNPRHMRRAWETIIAYIDALWSHAADGHIDVVCTDGLHMRLWGNCSADGEVNTLAVLLPPCGEIERLRKRWTYAKNPARGKFFGVQAADVVELIWQHGGIDMAQSRTATLRKHTEENKYAIHD